MINYNEIKSEIEKMVCNNHNQKLTEVEVSGSTITFKACCKDFEKVVVKKIADMEASQQGDDISELFKFD